VISRLPIAGNGATIMAVDANGPGQLVDAESAVAAGCIDDRPATTVAANLWRGGRRYAPVASADASFTRSGAPKSATWVAQGSTDAPPTLRRDLTAQASDSIRALWCGISP
jgi:hypothetical protein